MDCASPQKRNPGRGSQRLHRALGGTRILLAAAPTAPPCFCRWQRSSLLHRGFFTRRTIRRVLRVALAAFSAAPWQGFEKAERCPSLASLFPPQAAVGSAAVRIHPCISFFKADKTETPVSIGYRSSWWARVDCASRASKKAPQGLFYPPDCSAGRCCSNPPLQSPFSRQIKQKLRYPLDTGVLGGRGWIARAAHLKKPRRGFFTRRTVRRVDAVRIHPCSPLFQGR